MATKNFLIFDFGASNGRALVARFDGQKFSLEETHRFENRPVFAAGTLYWDILRLHSELEIGILKSVHKYRDIASLGLDTWGTDFGFIDKNGKLLANPIHYRDARRSSVLEEVFQIISQKELFYLTGMHMFPMASIFLMYALKKDKAAELLNAEKYLMMPDLFNYLLTGEVTNEFSDATMSLMLNQRTGKWEMKIFERLGFPPNLFSEVIMPGTRVGLIQPALCRKLEIAPLPVIAPAAHDTASAVAGVPVADENANWAFLSMGTWCTSGMEILEPLITEEVFNSEYGNEGGAEGRTFLAGNMTGQWILQQCREKWMKDGRRDLSWEEIVSSSAKAKSFQALIDVDDPVFGQPQVDMPRVIMEYCREKGQKAPAGVGEISRCVLESLALKFKQYFKQLERITSKKIGLLHLVGGGTRNPLLCQWTSNATDIPVKAGPAETTAAGNLIMQLKGMGEIGSLQEGRELVRRSSQLKDYMPQDREKWEEAYSKYSGLFSG